MTAKTFDEWLDFADDYPRRSDLARAAWDAGRAAQREADAKVIRPLIRRCEAQEKLLVCYRIGGHPSGKTLNDIGCTESAVETAKDAIRTGKGE